MKKILFLIHDLGEGGAEKVLVNLVNHLDKREFDVTVLSLFSGGVNEQFLRDDVTYKTLFKRIFRGNRHFFKLFSPKFLHRLLIREKYDIEISYLEGPCARIISGGAHGDTKLICWIHSNHFSMKGVSSSFRNSREAVKCYRQFDKIVCVSQFMRENFCQWVPVADKCIVLYNTVESDVILEKALESVPEIENSSSFRIVAVGTLKPVKAFDRLLRIVKRLNDEGNNIYLYLLGDGPLRSKFRTYIEKNHLEGRIKMPGYQVNPYKYVAKCDLFVCSSLSEGFSTAATEALIVGTPVCTVEVSGMKEMLGEHNEYGIVTENTEDALYEGIKKLLEDPKLLSFYKQQAKIRGRLFSTENTVKAVEGMLKG